MVLPNYKRNSCHDFQTTLTATGDTLDLQHHATSKCTVPSINRQLQLPLHEFYRHEHKTSLSSSRQFVIFVRYFGVRRKIVGTIFIPHRLLRPTHSGYYSAQHLRALYPQSTGNCSSCNKTFRVISTTPAYLAPANSRFFNGTAKFEKIQLA